MFSEALAAVDSAGAAADPPATVAYAANGGAAKPTVLVAEKLGGAGKVCRSPHSALGMGLD